MNLSSVRELGELTGEVLLFGGPYSNLEATLELLRQAKERAVPAGNRICTGDVMAYCAQPEETSLALRGQCVLVAGNCERQLASGSGDCGCGFEEGSVCDRLSAAWFPFAAERASADSLGWFADAPDILTFTHCERRVAVLHGRATDIAGYVWPVTEQSDFEKEIALLERLTGPIDIVVAGHSGIPFKRKIGRHLWVNAGVIGLPPNDGRSMTRFATLKRDGIRIERLAYDAAAASNRMRMAGLPREYADALETGIWPNEDILPNALRRTAT